MLKRFQRSWQKNTHVESQSSDVQTSTVASPQQPSRRVGDISGIVSDHPAAGASREEATTAIQAARDAAAAAASYLQPPGTAAMVSLEDRVTSLERLLSSLAGDNGTIDHLFKSLNLLNT